MKGCGTAHGDLPSKFDVDRYTLWRLLFWWCAGASITIGMFLWNLSFGLCVVTHIITHPF